MTNKMCLVLLVTALIAVVGGLSMSSESSGFPIQPAISVAISFDANGGSDAPPGMDGNTTDTVFYIPEEIPARYGHTFIGWSTSPESDTVSFHPGDHLSYEYISENAQSNALDLKLYAIWESNASPLSFKSDPAVDGKVEYIG